MQIPCFDIFIIYVYIYIYIYIIYVHHIWHISSVVDWNIWYIYFVVQTFSEFVVAHWQFCRVHLVVDWRIWDIYFVVHTLVFSAFLGILRAIPSLWALVFCPSISSYSFLHTYFVGHIIFVLAFLGISLYRRSVGTGIKYKYIYI